MGVSITTDSGCDLFPTLYLDYDIDIVPLYITVGDETYKDVFEVQTAQVFEYYHKTHRMSKTAAPPPSDYYALFKKHTAAGNDIVHLSINSKFSCSYQNACIAAEEFKNVHVIDTCTVSSAMGLLCLEAAELRDAGKSAEEIYQTILREKEKVRTYVLLDTLEFAYRGGRASMLQMFGANLLKLRPCLLLDNRGVLSVVKKFRGNFEQCTREYARYVLSQPNKDLKRAFVSTTVMDEGLFQASFDFVKRDGGFDQVLMSRAGCSMGVHTGPNTLVIFYKEK